MTRARSNARRVCALAAVLLAAALALAGCGRKQEKVAPLGFQFDSTAVDTVALARGQGLLSDFEPYRASDGALRVRGRFALPDGARLQVSIRRRADGREVGREQVLIRGGGFDTPPFLAPDRRPLATDDYQFELSTQFNGVWQPDKVLAATRSGLDLTGPGMRRGSMGEAIYRLTLERHL